MGSTVKSFLSYNEADKVKQPSPLQCEVDEEKASGLGLVSGLGTGLWSNAQGQGLGIGVISTTPRVVVYVEEEEGEITDSPSPSQHNSHSSLSHHSPQSSVSSDKCPTIVNGIHGGSGGSTRQRQYSCQHVIFTCQQHSYASIQVKIPSIRHTTSHIISFAHKKI